jgi:hypothetical protein
MISHTRLLIVSPPLEYEIATRAEATSRSGTLISRPTRHQDVCDETKCRVAELKVAVLQGLLLMRKDHLPDCS